MDNVKQFLFDTLVEEYNENPGFLLARTLFLFCTFNPSYELPADIHRAFVRGLMEDEVRAFNLRYPGRNGDEELQQGGTDIDKSLIAMKKDIHLEIAAENLSKGTGMTYSPKMVEKIARNFKSILSYNEILEVVVLSAHRKL